jgi:predicted dehydrogenase
MQDTATGLNRRQWFASTLAASAAAAAPLRLPGKIRVAVIGQDGHLGEILNPLPQLPDVEVVACCDYTEAALASLVAKKGMAGAKGYLNQEKMLDEVKPDVVAVVNDDGARAKAVLAALQRGIHCIAEKPLAITRMDLKKIKRVARDSKGRLGMLVPLRYAAPFRGLKQVVDSGEIGEVLLMGGQKSYKRGISSTWKNQRASYGSTMLWIGPHLVDLFHFTSGLRMTEAFCWQGNVKEPALGDRENVVGALFRLATGGMAEMRMDYLRPDTAPTHEDDRLRIAGTKGIVEYTAATGVTILSDGGKPRRLETLPEGGQIFMDYLDAVYNRKPGQLTVEEIFHVSDAIQAAEDSSRTGHPAKV